MRDLEHLLAHAHHKVGSLLLDEIATIVERSQSSALKEKRERPIYFGSKEQTYIQDNGKDQLLLSE